MIFSPLVTVCIPTYNAESFIAEALECALAQTYAPIEIVISDDDSSDRTVEIVKQLLDGKDVNWQLHTHARLGLAANWNHCISLAEGKYIKFLFQDDTITSDCIAKMVALAEQDAEIGLVFARRSIINSDDTKLDQLYVDITESWTNLSQIQLGQSLLADPKLFEAPLNKIGEPTAVLIAKDVFNQVGLFDPNLLQVLDLDMWLRIMMQYKIGYLDETLAGFRVHRDQQSIQNINTGASWIDDWRLQFKMMADHNSYGFLPIELRRSLVDFSSNRIIQTYEDMSALRSQVQDAYEDIRDAYEQLERAGDLIKNLYKELETLPIITAQLDLTSARLEQSHDRIASMESSKFWRLRASWLRLKGALGLRTEE